MIKWLQVEHRTEAMLMAGVTLFPTLQLPEVKVAQITMTLRGTFPAVHTTQTNGEELIRDFGMQVVIPGPWVTQAIGGYMGRAEIFQGKWCRTRGEEVVEMLVQ